MLDMDMFLLSLGTMVLIYFNAPFVPPNIFVAAMILFGVWSYWGIDEPINIVREMVDMIMNARLGPEDFGFIHTNGHIPEEHL